MVSVSHLFRLFLACIARGVLGWFFWGDLWFRRDFWENAKDFGTQSKFWGRTRISRRKFLAALKQIQIL